MPLTRPRLRILALLAAGGARVGFGCLRACGERRSSDRRGEHGSLLRCVDGAPSACASGGAPECGTTCDTAPPPGSGNACSPGSQGCPAGEFCDPQTQACTNEALRYWDQCGWCAFYSAPDCCAAAAAPRYVEFLHAFEAAVAASDENVTPSGCADSTRCVVESICQEDLASSLTRIARRLVGGRL